ncbi:MAG: molybdopterin dehydrogenase, FAD-binding protein [Thermoleophilia bacterium]|nr:molybdopterin dehydrogenase, FAD-binding protein [Thermoleophilia bacterium]
MIPAAFDYEVAESVDHAIALLGERDDAKLLAGGHSLLPAMKLRLARPALLVDVGRLADLSYVRDGEGHIAIGALTRHKDVASAALLREHCPIVAHTAGQVGDPQVRHRGTIGGSLAHGDPASDLPTVILALDGELVVRGSAGERTIPASAFFTGVFQTAIGSDEMLVEIRVPKFGSDTGWSYTKMSRRAQDWATVAVAAVVERSNGSVGTASIALTNMGATPLRAKPAEDAIAAGGSIGDASTLASDGTEPSSDHSASADFRRHLARVLTRRALEEAAGR